MSLGRPTSTTTLENVPNVHHGVHIVHAREEMSNRRELADDVSQVMSLLKNNQSLFVSSKVSNFYIEIFPHQKSPPESLVPHIFEGKS